LPSSYVGRDQKSIEYKLTEPGAELLDVIINIGTWGKRWIDQKQNLENTDVGLLIWDIRRGIKMDSFPLKQATVEFVFSDVKDAKSTWWMILNEQSSPDVGPIEPNSPVDLYVLCTLTALTDFWLGNISSTESLSKKRIEIFGDSKLVASFKSWIGKSTFSDVENLTKSTAA
tara:strand:+ start:269 stop:784 length:516 start_codon:yes stop_codon:yes gene_type:complete